MVAQKFGKSDPDIKKGSKETRDKEMLRASTKIPTTGMIGGTSNTTANPSEKKSGPTMKFAKGGAVSIAPYKEGGFRNAAMEHKR
jgi:hypothetical protein